jgi:hypothetical protein
MAGLVVFKSFNFLIQIVEFDPFHRPPDNVSVTVTLLVG